MQLSKELIMFSVGGLKFFENNAIIESFDEWNWGNPENEEFFMEVHRDCSRVYGSLLFKFHYEYPTSPRMLGNLQLMNNINNWQNLNRHADLFQDTNRHGYVATQFSHNYAKTNWL